MIAMSIAVVLPSAAVTLSRMSTPTHPLAGVLLLINRLTLGLYVAAAGLAALLGEVSGEFVKNSFINLRPSWLPALLARPLDYALYLGAIVFGVLLAGGAFTRIAALGIVVIGSVITLTLLSEFGLGGGGPNWIHHNLVMISLALLLASLGPGPYSADQTFLKKTWS